MFTLGIEVNSMEIGKAYQVSEQIVASVQAVHNQQVGDKTKAADSNVEVQQDFQVNLQDGFKTQLIEFVNTLQNREQLMQSLPENIRNAVVELLGQMSADTELPQGLENLLKGQKNASEQLKDMSNILEFSAVINKDEHSEVKIFLQKILENFTQQAGKNSEQSAKELVQLAKQLTVINAAVQGNSSQTLEEQTVPENRQQLSPNVQQNLLKLTNLLGQDMPAQLQLLGEEVTNTNTIVEQLKNMVQQLKNQMLIGDPKLLEKQQHVVDQIMKLFELNIPQVLQEGVVKNSVPELPKIWVMLKTLGAEQWQNIESHDLQKSAAVVKELAQSIYKLTGMVGEKLAEHSTLSFSIPLQVAEGIYYPAHIHIYHEQKDNSTQPTEREFETWLRVCVDTENIGLVDSVFRLFGDNKLDVRVNLPNMSAANKFAQNLPEVRKILENSKLKLTEVTVNKA